MYKEKILDLLKQATKGFFSGEELAFKLGISRTMVWKHIRALQREGYGIEAIPSQGYRITSLPDLLRLADIRKGLKTKIIGKEIHLLRETASTNSVGMEMASKGAPEGTVIVAERQSAGKGRLGRRWISPKGNLYVSIILRPEISTYKAPLITLLGAVSAASAIRAECGLPAGIKWPNDILLSGKKACGLLTEMSAEPDRIKHIVLGIGIDVNMDLLDLPEEIRAFTTTLSAEAGRRIDRVSLLRTLLRELEIRYQAFLSGDDAVLEEWKRLNITTGRHVAVSGMNQIVEGLAERIDAEGRLVITCADGTIHTVAAGDVTIVKKA
jgi:BirA family biotin operon repressor/biotin-[acetyl-CoA-carboxylase] ligase